MVLPVAFATLRLAAGFALASNPDCHAIASGDGGSLAPFFLLFALVIFCSRKKWGIALWAAGCLRCAQARCAPSPLRRILEGVLILRNSSRKLKTVADNAILLNYTVSSENIS